MACPIDRIDPSVIDEFTCPTCFQSFLALFLYLKHSREAHGDRLAPLSPACQPVKESA
jgi:hypothetical protein